MPLVDWTGNAALVTGGASGLGAATAMRLAKAGLKVTILDLNGDLGRQQADSIKGITRRLTSLTQRSVSAGIADAQAHHGPARILVNCAGIGGAAKTVSRGEAHDPDMFRQNHHGQSNWQLHLRQSGGCRHGGSRPCRCRW